MIDLKVKFNRAAINIFRIAIGLSIFVFFLRMFRQPIAKVLNYVKIPKEYIAVFTFLGNYKVDILIVILLLLLSVAYTRNMNFNEKKPTEQAELIVETMNN